MELNLFERPIAHMCYCASGTSGGVGACAPCRERAKAKPKPAPVRGNAFEIPKPIVHTEESFRVLDERIDNWIQRKVERARIQEWRARGVRI